MKPRDYAHGYDKLSDAELLEKVRRGWKCGETPCGTGSTIQNTRKIRSLLPKLAQSYGIESISDAGAGDLNWLPLIKWSIYYRAFDLYPRHQSVTQFDITKSILPESDLILCRHVLNHLSIRKACDAIGNFRESGSKYLLMTNCENQAEYWEHFGFYPFSEPLDIFDDCQHWHLELYEL